MTKSTTFKLHKRCPYFTSKFFAYVCLTLWFVFLIMRIFTNSNPNHFAVIIGPMIFMSHWFMLFLSIKLYRALQLKDRKILFWLTVACIGLFFDDLFFYFNVYWDNKFLVNLSLSPFALMMSSYFVWIIAIIVFIWQIIIKHILSKKQILKAIMFMIVINSVILCLFFISYHSVFPPLSPQTMAIIANFFLDALAFNCVITSLIYVENKGIFMTLYGLGLLIAGDFFISYIFISQSIPLLSLGSLIWLLGLIFVFYGFININVSENYNIKNWFGKSKNIKSKLNIWSVNLAIVSFLSFITIADLFNFINKTLLVNLPLLMMIFTMIVIFISIFMGKTLESPFKQLVISIDNLIIHNDKSKIASSFSIEEFEFLQTHLVNTFKLREEQDAIRKKFGDMAASMVHDIASPIMVMQGAVSNLQNDEFVKNNNNLKLLQTSMQSVKGIAYNLLKRYRDSDVNGESFNGVQEDDSNLPRYIILSSLLEKIIANKNMELASTTGKITFDVNSSSISAWMYLSPLQISRTMSNLLNNAYESMDKSEQKIIVSLSVTDNNFILSIQDNGSGIPQDKIDEVLSGTSLKHPGQGLGLSGAKNYFESLGGKLQVESNQGVGTTIKAVFPVANKPIWFEREITYSNESIFLVLDDDQSIIALWCSVLPMADVDVKYFFSASQFQEWYMDNKPDPRHVILLVDYNLHDEKFNGLDIIERYAPGTAYLFTSHAEELWMQQLAEEKSIKLSPKSLIESMNIAEVSF